jgi:hypothetical protein
MINSLSRDGPWLTRSRMMAANYIRDEMDDHLRTYRMVYGDDERVIRETFTDVQVQREDGWVVLFRGKEAILRMREEHVQSLDEVTGDEG